ncbi:MAG TPA: hypothetical protein DCM40_08100, partial [Maribacter sp.]|nr:hypothetical protein [Maribacter sp.]
ALNEESIYEAGSYTIENLACCLNFNTVNMAELIDYGEISTEIYNESKYYKFTTSITVPMCFSYDFALTTYENLFDILSEEYQNMSVYVFTSPIDWFDYSDDTRESIRTNKNLVNKFAGKISYQDVFKNGEIVPNEETNFVLGISEQVVDSPVLLDLENNY